MIDLTEEELSKFADGEPGNDIEKGGPVPPPGPDPSQETIDKLLASIAIKDQMLDYGRAEYANFCDRIQTWASSELQTLSLLTAHGHFEALRIVMPPAVQRLDQLLGMNLADAQPLAPPLPPREMQSADYPEDQVVDDEDESTL
jgi:hypothetical protein